MSAAGDGEEAPPPRPLVERDAALWAIRFFIGREPTDEAEVQFHRGHPSLESVRRAFSLTGEFQAYYESLQPASAAYAAPLFLLEPPPAGIPARFAPPSLNFPVSQLCTAAQLRGPAFASWCARLGLPPQEHRKIWEFCYVAAVADLQGMLQPGVKALGFGVGQEPLPALFARHGLQVLATDAPAELIAGQGWDSTGQHAQGLSGLERPGIVENAAFHRQVRFAPVDMNAIPAGLTGFDLCWSSCAFEHLGSLEHGLRFVEASLATLRPGGLAIHTTEFNLSSNEDTFEAANLCLYRKRDVEALMARLVAAGHAPLPLNFHPGAEKLDEHVDLPPYALPHLKLKVGRYVTTSIGLAIRKGG
ncbi:methyltransferase domain-containing protein [Siccirubricoccus phaeus]|uniref:hypothetical protein n=1 Tax=Siccirubricoccus phaeus TaxID=2595053 RepID=UPI0011F0C334|nr:hypothetical protein [Siccirubricoccus phaeus]